MEFPATGNNCSHQECNLLDFLPVLCEHCQLQFCSDHSGPIAHSCPKVPDRVVEQKTRVVGFVCSSDNCTTRDALEMTCSLCQKHFCVEHRIHSCHKPTMSKKESLKMMKEQFKQVKAQTDKKVGERLKSSSNRALANKVRVMKLKAASVGDNHIPVDNRAFFCVAPPLGNNESSMGKGFFVDLHGTVGKAIDSTAKRFKLINKNNILNEPKLRLFNIDGGIICAHTDATIDSLIKSKALVEGDCLILEYVDQWELEDGNIKVFDDPERLSKYQWPF